jgi:hypothetical protein
MGWCCERGLNSRPLHYQWSALPLSYRSRFANAADFCHIIDEIASKQSYSLCNLSGRLEYEPACGSSDLHESEEMSSSKKPNTEQENREKRRSEQLRANLARRKQQTRSRRAGAPDERDEGLNAATETEERSSTGES